jgi:hypothetical protein
MNRSRLLPLALLLACSATAVQAQFVSGRLSTAFYAWEQFDTVGTSQQFLRAYQTAQVTVAQGDVSLTTFLQGTTNLAGTFGGAGRVRFYNLYLSWTNIGKVVDLHLGRQGVYAGAGVGTIDGLLARARLFDKKVTVTGYGGSTVGPEFTGVRSNMHDNYFYGGQVVTSALKGARIGLSYMNRHEERDPYWTLRARDTSFAPVPYYVSNDSPAEELGSADARYDYGDRVSVYGRYDYDFLNERTSRAQGGARVQVTPDFSVNADYIHRVPRVFYNSIFSAFVTNSVDEFEGGVEYGFTPMLRLFGRMAWVSYTDEQSHRWTLGLNAGYGSVAYSGSDGYAGELTSFSVQGSYPLFGRMVIPTAGISYASYRLSAESSRDEALSLLLGAMVRLTSAFSCDVQGQWLTNKLMQRDLRLQLRLNYWFAQRLSLLSGEGKQ